MSDQIELLNAAVKREDEKIEDLKLKCEMFSFGEFDENDQDELLKQFDSGVSKGLFGNVVRTVCIKKIIFSLVIPNYLLLNFLSSTIIWFLISL